jgi:FADH2 O2-dependent halogenase
MAKHKEIRECDILIAGSGFAGSLMALILDRCGFKVCLVEKHQHPRFAIGESSTPIANMVLRDLSKKYDMSWLSDFSSYGSWQQNHPGIICGLKRGFSYYGHRPGKPFYTDTEHSNELLVAASINDIRSDTHWLRADFDAFLVGKVRERGIAYMDRTEILSVDGKGDDRFFSCKGPEGIINIDGSFFLDATGNSHLLEILWGVPSSPNGFKTCSHAIFSHFMGVPRWKDHIRAQGFSAQDYPFDPDHSALHHLLEEGWIWMLRFNDERLSMGLMLNGEGFEGSDPKKIWQTILSRYPSLNKMMESASLSPLPGKFIATKRLQRMSAKAFGPDWAALPHTVGFVDPLHSTGIAHTLCGVEKLVNLLQNHWGKPEKLHHALQDYGKTVRQELLFMDILVAGCYRSLSHFELFNAWTMLYFTTAIAYERKRLQGNVPQCFLEAGNIDLQKIINVSYADLLKVLKKPSTVAVKDFIDRIRERIAPYNVAGLLDPSLHNMYYHSAAEL